ncbi:MAG: hypothetical protein AMXMBFR47_27920 [Planctomycetota bacterium]
MDDAAHGMAPKHDIFNTPNKIDFTLEDRPTPPQYRHYVGGEKLGETMKVRRVQTKRNSKGVDPGLVSEPSNFDSAPDAEIMSSGLNSKGPQSVAIGRHGNFLLWGFSADPDDLTDEGKLCLINCICYIHKFDRQAPLARKHKWTRGRAYAVAQTRYVKDESEEGFKRSYPEALRREFGRDGGKYREYYEKNMEFLNLTVEEFKFPDASGAPVYTALAMRYWVDEDAMAWGISNRTIALLDRCVTALEKNQDDEVARRLLARYTTQEFREAAEWRTWLDANRKRIFFSDIAGYKFLVAPRDLPTASP